MTTTVADEDSSCRRPQRAHHSSVVFCFDWPEVSGEHEVRVVGNCPGLGSWRSDHAPSLSRLADGSSIWKTPKDKRVLLPLNEKVEYKYVLCKRTTGEVVEWEPKQEANRILQPTGPKHVVEDDGGLHRDVVSSAPPVGAGEDFQRARSYSALNLEEDETVIASNDVVIICVQKLPYSIKRDADSGGWTVEEMVASDDSFLPFLRLLRENAEVRGSLHAQIKFLGLPDVIVTDESERKQITEALNAVSCIPVFVDEEKAPLQLGETRMRYLKFTHFFLWPVFHNMKVFAEEANAAQVQTFDEDHWKAYQAVNNAYANVVEKHRSSSTYIWVQDYSLILVPRYVYLRDPDIPVALFMHSSFPSPEVLSCMPNREEILKSMLCCRFMAFQIFDHMRHFISCCELLLGARHTFQKGGVMQIEYEGKAVVITADHFVIPYAHLSKILQTEEVGRRAAELREPFQGKTIIGSYDKCERFSNLVLKLRLFHQFLSEYRTYHGKVVLVQYIKLDRMNEEQLSMLKDLERMAAETNAAFAIPGESPVVNIIVEDASLGYAKLLASLQVIDIYFNTSSNDGLNIVPFMFYLSHSQDKKGIAVVSEFCGCSFALTGIFKVNPFNPTAIMTALDEALSISDLEQAKRFAKDHSYISTQALETWVSNNVSELKRVKLQSAFQVAGFDACFRNSFMGSGFRQLEHDIVLNAYKQSKCRVLIFDFEGTLAAKADYFIQTGLHGTALERQGVPPDPKILEDLQLLANDCKNLVFIISGRNPKPLSSWFGEVKGLGLCAEHGYYWKPPPKFADCVTHSAAKHGFFKMVDVDDEGAESSNWKTVTINVMQLYVKRVQGSILEVKDSGYSWNYRGLGGSSLIRELAMELARFLDPESPQGALYGFPVKVVCGKGYLEVRRKDVDKGIAAHRILELATKLFGACPQFALCMGDDRSDEDMFAKMNSFFDDRSSTTTTMQHMASCSNLQTQPVPSPFEVPTQHMASSKLGMHHVASEGGNLKDCGNASAPVSPTVKKRVNPQFFTVTVGRKPSIAGSYVRDTGEVSELIGKLAAQSTALAFSRYASSPNLTGFAGIQWDRDDSEEA